MYCLAALWLAFFSCCWISSNAVNNTLSSKAQVSRRFLDVKVNNGHHFLIIVLTKDRAKPLQRLLDSIGNAEYGDDKMRLEIHVDYGDDDAHREVLKVARGFKLTSSSSKTRIVRKKKGGIGGLRQAWLDAWKTPKGRAIILEDDIELSPYWYTWLKAAWASYDSEELAGISLQRQTLIPMKPQKSQDLVHHTDPFLYKLVGSIGFSPHPHRWREFLAWVQTIDLDTFPAVVDGLVTTDWYQKHDKKSIWTQLFIYFCEERNLYTLYSYHKNKETLAAHMRERGEHFKTSKGADFPVAKVSPDLSRMPRSINDLQKLEWSGEIVVEGAMHTKEFMSNINSRKRDFPPSDVHVGINIVYSLGMAGLSDVSNTLVGDVMKRYNSSVWLYSCFDADGPMERLSSSSAVLQLSTSANFHHIERNFFASALGGSTAFAFGSAKKHEFALQSEMKHNGHKIIDLLKIDVPSLTQSIAEEILGWLREQWVPFKHVLFDFHELRKCKKNWESKEGCGKAKILHRKLLNGFQVNGFRIVSDYSGDKTRLWLTNSATMSELSNGISDKAKPKAYVSDFIEKYAEKSVVSVISSSMTDFANNWWLSLRLHAIAGDFVVTIVSLSPSICDDFMTGDGEFNYGLLRCTYVAGTLRADNGSAVVYRAPQYIENVAHKLHAFSAALDHAFDDTIILFSDVDVVFLKDPFSFEDIMSDSKTDIWFSNNARGDKCFIDAPAASTSQINTGFYFARANSAVRKLLHDAIVRLTEGDTYDGGDQGAIQSVIRSSEASTYIHSRMLSCAAFPNGNVFFATDFALHPVAVHANWIRTSEVKRECLRLTGLWFSEITKTDVELQPHSTKVCTEDGGVIMNCGGECKQFKNIKKSKGDGGESTDGKSKDKNLSWYNIVGKWGEWW